MFGILRYANSYKGFIEDVQKVNGRYIEQEAEICKLQAEVETMNFFADKEVGNSRQKMQHISSPRKNFRLTPVLSLTDQSFQATQIRTPTLIRSNILKKSLITCCKHI